MPSRHRQILRFFSFRRISIPIFIGLSVATILFVRDFDSNLFANIQWAKYPALWFLLVLVLIATRDLAYMYRIRLLTDGELTWKKSFQVIMLWEFASSITPSIVGGSAVALFVVRKEGINMGRTTAVVMTTALLDELFYILMVPIVIIIVGTSDLFITEPSFIIAGQKFSSKGVFIIGYLFILLLTSIILFGIFISPAKVKKMLVAIFKIRFLRRWAVQAAQTGDELMVTSAEMKSKSAVFWIKAYLATVISWTARFWVVNTLIMAFAPVGDHFLIYARQLVMWVILLISPTPGGSGIAEYFFPIFLGEFIGPGLSTPLAILWRLISYYPYIFIGVLVLPIWFRRIYFKNRRSITFRSK
jgi:glycosyltransferase 2 family protein